MAHPAQAAAAKAAKAKWKARYRMPKPYDMQPRHVEAVATAMAETHSLIAFHLLVESDDPNAASRQQLLGALLVRCFQSFMQRAHAHGKLSPEVSTYKATKEFIAQLKGYHHGLATGSRAQLTAALKEALESLQLPEDQE